MARCRRTQRVACCLLLPVLLLLLPTCWSASHALLLPLLDATCAVANSLLQCPSPHSTACSALEAAGGSAGQLLELLGGLLGTHAAVLALCQQRYLRPTLGLLALLAAQVALAWRSAAGAGADPTAALAGHQAVPPEVMAALAAATEAEAAPAAAGDDAQQPSGAEAAAAPPPAATAAAAAAPAGALPPELADSLGALGQRQAEAQQELSDAADLLRFWSRRSEKAAAGAEASGREGGLPPMLAEAQQLLWAASQAYEEEQAASDLQTRQLVCQRYRPLDLAQLQQRADDFADGERLPAQQALNFEPEFVQLRGWARALTLRFLQGGQPAWLAAWLPGHTCWPASQPANTCMELQPR